jgi:hypothetical protein
VHEDGDGYWPAANLVADWQADWPPELAMRAAENVAPHLRLPGGWEWDSDTAFVHIGPPATLRDGVAMCEMVVSRAVRQADQPGE